MGEPRALTAPTATFAASWRDSNCTVRAGNHMTKKTIKIRTREIKMRRSWNSSYPPPWRQTRPATLGRHWPPPRPHEEQPKKTRGRSQAGRSPESPWNSGSEPPSTPGGSAGHCRRCTNWRNLTMKPAWKTQHQRAR